MDFKGETSRQIVHKGNHSKIKTNTSQQDESKYKFSNLDSKLKCILLAAVEGLEPVGINKHFYMAIILERLKNKGINMAAKEVWNYLESLYNLKLMNKQADEDYSIEEIDLELPFEEFGELMAKKRDETVV